MISDPFHHVHNLFQPLNNKTLLPNLRYMLLFSAHPLLQYCNYYLVCDILCLYVQLFTLCIGFFMPYQKTNGKLWLHGV